MEKTSYVWGMNPSGGYSMDLRDGWRAHMEFTEVFPEGVYKFLISSPEGVYGIAVTGGAIGTEIFHTMLAF